MVDNYQLDMINNPINFDYHYWQHNYQQGNQYIELYQQYPNKSRSRNQYKWFFLADPNIVPMGIECIEWRQYYW